ncbi:hypothetical protein BKA80DRAFT_133409 [Phyllosticta citrichinensis]
MEEHNKSCPSQFKWMKAGMPRAKALGKYCTNCDTYGHNDEVCRRPKDCCTVCKSPGHKAANCPQNSGDRAAKRPRISRS